LGQDFEFYLCFTIKAFCHLSPIVLFWKELREKTEGIQITEVHV